MAVGERCSPSHALSTWVIESWQNVSSRASRALSKASKHTRSFLIRSLSFLPSATSLAREKRGKQPYWPSTIMRHFIQPVARELGMTINLLGRDAIFEVAGGALDCKHSACADQHSIAL